MKLILCLVLFFLIGCKEKKKETPTNPDDLEKTTERSINHLQKSYRNKTFGFSLSHPDNYEIYEAVLPGDVPVVNIFQDTSANPPLAIHEDANLNYIAFLPEGYGVDGPGGKRKTIQEWKGQVPVSFGLDSTESAVYLLENGEPWAFFLALEDPPENWSKHGGIFVHYKVKNLETRCFDQEKQDFISPEGCDPLMGDSLRLHGNVPSEEKEILNAILGTLSFTDKIEEKAVAADPVQVEYPQPQSPISSPLQIRGEARGSWFFEGVAPFRLMTEDGKLLAKGNIKAIEDWMTEDFVPFEAEVAFRIPKNEKRGYLVINRANASGMPEHDQAVRIPVIFIN